MSWSKGRSGDVSVLRSELLLPPGDDDMFASRHIPNELEREPAFKILFAVAKTTFLTGMPLGTGAWPAD